jgi:co-chaperonin GroES (HSP10)
LENTSGIYPAGYRILIKPDAVEEITPGGIYIPPSEKDKYQRAQQTGVVIALGPEAFDDCAAAWAKPGDRVFFSRYEGDIITGEDGDDYRLVNDRCVLAHASDGIRLGDLDVKREPLHATA